MQASRGRQRAHLRMIVLDDAVICRGDGRRVQHLGVVVRAGHVRSDIKRGIRKVHHGLQGGRELGGEKPSRIRDRREGRRRSAPRGHRLRRRHVCTMEAVDDGANTHATVEEIGATGDETPTQRGGRGAENASEATCTATNTRESAAETTQHTVATRRRHGQSRHHRVECRLRRGPRAEARGDGVPHRLVTRPRNTATHRTRHDRMPATGKHT